MDTHRLDSRLLVSELRARTADFFKIEVARTARVVATRDPNPLRRSLNMQQGIEVWDSNENMCFALWELMARS